AANLVGQFEQSIAVRQAMWNDAGKPDHWDPHIGALGFHEGVLFVPVQNPYGVWRIDVATGSQTWLRPSVLPDNDMFPWCAVHPVTGVLYTCNSPQPPALRAYDRDTLAYRPQDDVPFRFAPLPLDKVQGGTFTSRGRLLLVRWDFNCVFC